MSLPGQSRVEELPPGEPTLWDSKGTRMARGTHMHQDAILFPVAGLTPRLSRIGATRVRC